MSPTSRSALRVALPAVLALACESGTAPSPNPAPPPSASLPFSWPTTQARAGDGTSLLAQGFAEFDDGSERKYHTGLDIRAEPGSEVRAAAEGWVAVLQKDDPVASCSTRRCDHGMGNTVILRHRLADGREVFTQYSHLANWNVSNPPPVVRAVFESAECREAVTALRWTCGADAVDVTRGQVVGAVGGTGRVPPYSPHLHFEVKAHAALGATANDGDDTYGYGSTDPSATLLSTTTTDPAARYFDPIDVFHPDAVPLGAPRPVRALAGGADLAILMGPGGETVGAGAVAYRAIDEMSTALAVEAVAEARTVSVSGCSRWFRIRRSTSSGTRLRFVDRLEPDLSTGRTGELPIGWVCAESVTETFPPTIAASSGQPPQAGPSDLYMVETVAPGLDHRIGRIRTQSGFEPVITDVAVGPGGALWAISFTTLYRVDVQTGVAVDVGPLNVSTANALAFDSQGRLYSATWDDGSFLQVDTITGAATRLGGFGSGFTSWGDLAFAPDGTLFAAVRSALNAGVLVTVDPRTGVAARVGSIGVGDVFGLAFVGNALFGLTADLGTGTGALLRIDTSTGAAVVIRSLSFDAFGGGVRARTLGRPPAP